MILRRIVHPTAVIPAISNVMMGMPMNVWGGITQTTSTVFMDLDGKIRILMVDTTSGLCGLRAVLNVDRVSRRGSEPARNPYRKEKGQTVLTLDLHLN